MQGPDGIVDVRWTCATCTPALGNAVCTPECNTVPAAGTWHVPSVTLSAGTNVLTVIAEAPGGALASDTLTVTYTPPPAAGVCTHYAAQAGGGNGLTQGSPFQVAQFWGVATPGAVLCLLDGTYTGGNSMLQPPSGLSGTASLPITVQALTEGAVLLDGQHARNPVVLSSTNQWWVVRGLNAANGLTNVFQFVGANNRGTRLLGWNATSGQSNTSIFTVAGANTVVEDCGGWGAAAQVVLQGSKTVSSPNSGYRRCWCEWNGHPGTGTAGGACAQPGVGQFLENIVTTVDATDE
jgi:hypothetical protein